MLPEILNIQVPQKILQTAPSDYLNARKAIESDKHRILIQNGDIDKKYLKNHANSADEDTMSDDTATGDEAALSRFSS